MYNNVEHQYLDLLEKCMTVGRIKDTRNGKTHSLFGELLSHDMALGFPLFTTKKMAWRSILTEFLWFIKGERNIQWLLKRGNGIWTGDAMKRFENLGLIGPSPTAKYFESAVLKNDAFASVWGDIGPAYGHQYRNLEGADQLADLVLNLKLDPYSRRHVVSLWEVQRIHEMLLPPCMWAFQCNVRTDSTLDMLFHIRSSDLPLGLPFNVATSGLFMLTLCHLTGLKPGILKWMLGDAHIYANQLPGVKEQIRREPLYPPRVEIVGEITDIGNFEEENFVVHSYNHHGKIEFPLSN